MRQGKGKNNARQYEAMFTFCRGKFPKGHNQIKILAEGVGNYRNVYTAIQKYVTKPNSDSTASSTLYLMKSLSLDLSVSFRAGIEITYQDLEKKNIISPLLVT